MKTPFFILFFSFFVNTLFANISPPDTCMTMVLHSGKKLQVSAVQVSEKIISFRNCANYNRAQAIAVDSVLSITNTKDEQVYAAGEAIKKLPTYDTNINTNKKKLSEKHKISMETGLFHRPWFYIDDEKVGQGEFDAFLWRNLSKENAEFMLKKTELERKKNLWQIIGYINYFLLLLATAIGLILMWLIVLPLAITSAIVFNVYNAKVKKAYNNAIAAYNRQLN